MQPDEIETTIRQASGFASLGMHLEAGELIETVPPDGSVRLQPAVIAVRLMVR